MRIIIAMVIITLSYSCTKQPTTWDTDLSLPLLSTTLSLENLFPDSILSYSNDGSVSIKIQENLIAFGIDSILEIPSDTIERAFSIAPLTQFTFSPGQTFYSSSNTFEFTGTSAELTSAILKEGTLAIKALNQIHGALLFKVTIPKAKINGQPLNFETTLPPAAGTVVGQTEFIFDLSGYELDLTGNDGNGFNTLSVLFSLTVPENGPSITAYIDENVILSSAYSDLGFSFAGGYFGMDEFDIGESSKFLDFPALQEAIIDFDQVESTLKISNGFGLDIRAFLFQIKALNSFRAVSLSLENSLVGNPINLSRASLQNGQLVDFEKVFLLNNSNSNIDEMLELIPDSVTLAGAVKANPFGNISNYNDFATDKSGISGEIMIDIPLKLSIDQLVFIDTAAFEWVPNELDINYGRLYLAYSNSFPVDLELDLIALDQSGTTVLNLTDYLQPNSTQIIEGRTDSIAVEGLVVYDLDMNATKLLKASRQIAIRATLKTTNYPDQVVFGGNDKLDIQISSNVNTSVHIE